MAFNTQASTRRLMKKLAEQERAHAEWLAKQKQKQKQKQKKQEPAQPR